MAFWEGGRDQKKLKKDPGTKSRGARRHQGGTKEAPRRHQGGTREAPRRHWSHFEVTLGSL